VSGGGGGDHTSNNNRCAALTDPEETLEEIQEILVEEVENLRQET